jgi:hypothetical protein
VEKVGAGEDAAGGEGEWEVAEQQQEKRQGGRREGHRTDQGNRM